MSQATVYVDKTYLGSAIIKVCRGKSFMKLVIPEFVVIENKGFTVQEQNKILITLVQQKEALLKAAAEKDYKTQLQI